MNERPTLPREVPSLSLEGLRIGVLGWEFPDATDDWDANWLRISATYSGGGSRIDVSGPILDTVSFATFDEELAAMHATLRGTATLASVEPNLHLALQFSDQLGHIGATLEMTPDHMTERHSFKFSLDQSDIPGLLSQLRVLRAAFPVRGRRHLGV